MLRYYTIALLILATIEAVPSRNNTRIVNGANAPSWKFKYIVKLEYDDGNDAWSCDGSLIRFSGDSDPAESDLVVTANHCVTHDDGLLAKYSSMTVWAGGSSHSTQKFEASRSVRALWSHGKDQYFRGDIAILVLSSPFKTSETIQTIRIAHGDSWDRLNCQIAGWGRTSDNPNSHPQILQWGAVAVQNADYCSYYWPNYDDSSQVCIGAGARQDNGSPLPTICNGDSGGPLTCLGPSSYSLLIGVTSFAADSCTDKPAVFTYVPHYYDWIMEKARYWGAKA